LISLSIFIPAYNAERHLGSVVERIPAAAWDLVRRVHVINDGSRDRTQEVIDGLCSANPKIRFERFPENRGYGSAVKAGVRRAVKDGSDYAFCLHADGQYPPESIAPFAALAAQRGLDLLQGSRMAPGTALEGGMPLYKFIAGKILTAAQNRVYGLSLTDYHSGFLCYSRRALLAIPFERLSHSFDIDIEAIVAAKDLGLAIGEEGIPTRYAEERSRLNPVLYGLRVLRIMGRHLAGKGRHA